MNIARLNGPSDNSTNTTKNRNLGGKAEDGVAGVGLKGRSETVGWYLILY